MHLVLQSIRAGKYFPHDEMFIIDNSFWQKCREKNMSGYNGLFVKSFEFLEWPNRVAHNEQGLALLGNLKNVRPESQPNTYTKLKISNKSPTDLRAPKLRLIENYSRCCNVLLQ